ncbi:hypothetical protein ACS0TY_034138 [Phlomoides rotata]
MVKWEPTINFEFKHKFVLDEPKLGKPTNESSEEDKEYHKEWLRSDELARCTILAFMSDVLQH